MSTHTPTPPWQWKKANEGNTADIYTEEPFRHTPIAKVWSGARTGDTEDIAAFIVRACNSHDALVAALRKAENALDNNDVDDYTRDCALSAVRAALKLAEGEA